MRILLVSDLHGREVFFDWVAAQAGAYDVICIAGDLLDTLATPEHGWRRQVRRVLSWLAAFPSFRSRLFVISGNHDWWIGDDDFAEAAWLQRARRKNVFVDGDIAELGDSTFVCYGWNCPIVLPDSRRLIVLNHAPVEGTLTAYEEPGRDLGDFELRAAIESGCGKVHLVLGGHVHSPRRFSDVVASARCFNAGADLQSRVPRHIIIDTLRGRAHWVVDNALRRSIAF